MPTSGPRLRLGGVLLAAFFVASLLSAPTQARKKKRGKSKGRTVALFYVAKDKPNAKLFGNLVQELTRAKAQVPDLKLLYGKGLKKKLRKKPDAAINKCGSNIKCIAKLGRKAKVKEVVYARVSPAGKGIKAQFLVVDVAGKSIARRVEMEVDSLNALTAILPAKIDEMFGVAAAEPSGGGDELSLDMVLGDDEGGGDELPLEVATGPTPPPPPADEPNGGDELALDFAVGDDDAAATDASSDDDELALDFAVGDAGDSDASATGDEGATGGPPPFDESNATEIAALDADMSSGSTATASASDGGGAGILTYAGIGVAGLGAVGVGLGGLFGMQAGSKRDEIQRGAGGTTQIEARAINKDANALANRANLLFGVGGGLILVGGTLLAVDMMSGGDSSAPTTSVSVGEGSASLQLGWSW